MRNLTSDNRPISQDDSCRSRYILRTGTGSVRRIEPFEFRLRHGLNIERYVPRMLLQIHRSSPVSFEGDLVGFVDAPRAAIHAGNHRRRYKKQARKAVASQEESCNEYRTCWYCMSIRQLPKITSESVFGGGGGGGGSIGGGPGRNPQVSQAPSRRPSAV